MRQLVEAEQVAANQITVRGCRAKQDRLFPEKRRSRVLHAAIRKSRNQHQIVFGKRKGLSKVVAEEFHALGGDLLQLGSLSDRSFILRVAHIDARQSGCLMHFAERTSGEGKEVGADRLGFGKNLCPIAGNAIPAFG